MSKNPESVPAILKAPDLDYSVHVQRWLGPRATIRFEVSPAQSLTPQEARLLSMALRRWADDQEAKKSRAIVRP